MRPLICQTPDGRRYVMPSPPRHTSAPAPRQPTSDTASPPEPTPKAKPRPRLKLTDATVREIRADYAAGRWSQGDLAYIYGVSQNTINRIVHGLVDGIKTQPNQQGQPNQQHPRSR